MYKYRFAQHKTARNKRFSLSCNLPRQAMLVPCDVPPLQLALICNSGTPKGLLVSAVNGRRRELTRVTATTIDKSGTQHYDLSVNSIDEFQTGQDVALEFSIDMGKAHIPVLTLTFVRDDSTNSSVFVVGSPRSGTTIIGNSLRRTLAIDEGFGESHLLPMAAQVKQTVLDYHQNCAASTLPGMMLNQVNPHLLGEQMLGLIKRQYSNAFNSGWILDKTPGGPMIRALPEICRLWPDARVIFAKRRGIENVTSRMTKFPDVDFETHCIQWKNCMNLWQGVKPNIDHSIEIDQFDILTNPKQVARRLVDFLALSDEQFDTLSEAFSVDKPEQTRSTRDPSLALDLNSIDWSDEQKNVFLDQCSEVLGQWNYSHDQNYYDAA